MTTKARTRAAAVAAAGGVAPDSTGALHGNVEAVLGALQEHIASYEIPEYGVLDVDSMIGSIGPLMQGIGEALTALAEGAFGDSPVHTSVVEMLGSFAGAVGNMAEDAVEVHSQWQQNPDNAHDLARAQGEIANAALFNVEA